MSNKTLKQRIAVVAVSALTAGVLSVVSAPVANAAIAAPTAVSCTAGDAQITLSWTAPVLSGGDTSVASYTYATEGTTYIALPVGGGAATTTRTITTVSAAGTAALANGTAYSVTLKGISQLPTTSAASVAVICTPGVPEPGAMYIATTASTTGSADQASGVSVGTKSVGWVSQTSATASSAYNGLTLSGSNAATATVLPGAKIAFNATSTVTSGDSLGIVASGGTLSNFACLNAGTASITGSLTTAACVQASTTRSTAYGVFTVGTTAGSVSTLAIYKGTTIAGTSTATNGTLLGIFTFTVVAANTSGSYNAANSTVTQQAAIAAGVAASTTVAYDTTSRIANSKVGIIYLAVKDAYLAALADADITSISASTSAGTLNLVDAAASSDSYAATSSFVSIGGLGSDGVGYVYVTQPVANTAGTATVTITLDGAVIATKTLNWAGDVATLTVDTVSSATSFINGYALATPITVNPGAIGNVTYVAKDAAGNAVTLAAQPTITGATGALVGATVYSGTTAVDGGAYQTSTVGYGYTTMTIPSSSLRGAGTYKIKLTNAVGTSITSAAQSVTVSNGGPNSFTASWDKASYAPGDLATLTITAKDVYGNLVGYGTALPGLTAGLIVSSGLTAAGSACVDASYTDTLGVKTCKYAVGNTEGSYSWSVDLNTVTAQSALLGSVKIAATTAVVSFAEVLKSVVALIASINKQIQALQKLILKR